MDTTPSFDGSITEVINLLSDLVVFNHYDFHEFLQRLIKVVSTIVPADSCFIYFYDRRTKQSILIASKKSHEDAIGNVVIKEGEGITNWVVQHEKTVTIEEHAYKDPRFKSFKELPEDTYESFLSVPIVDRSGVVGVINIQNRKPYTFSKQQVKAIESLVKIIASAFAQVVLEGKVDTLKNQLEERKTVEKAKGVLMKIKNMSEDDAFRFIRKEAMNKRKSLKEIADAILLVWQT